MLKTPKDRLKPGWRLMAAVFCAGMAMMGFALWVLGLVTD